MWGEAYRAARAPKGTLKSRVGAALCTAHLLLIHGPQSPTVTTQWNLLNKHCSQGSPTFQLAVLWMGLHIRVFPRSSPADLGMRGWARTAGLEASAPPSLHPHMLVVLLPGHGHTCGHVQHLGGQLVAGEQAFPLS